MYGADATKSSVYFLLSRAFQQTFTSNYWPSKLHRIWMICNLMKYFNKTKLLLIGDWSLKHIWLSNFCSNGYWETLPSPGHLVRLTNSAQFFGVTSKKTLRSPESMLFLIFKTKLSKKIIRKWINLVEYVKRAEKESSFAQIQEWHVTWNLSN